LPLATSHGYAEWDFSGVLDPVMFQRFLDAAVLTIDFGTPSYKFTVNICMYLIF
jgi:hypothetical protein